MWCAGLVCMFCVFKAGPAFWLCNHCMWMSLLHCETVVLLMLPTPFHCTRTHCSRCMLILKIDSLFALFGITYTIRTPAFYVLHCASSVKVRADCTKFVGCVSNWFVLASKQCKAAPPRNGVISPVPTLNCWVNCKKRKRKKKAQEIVITLFW